MFGKRALEKALASAHSLISDQRQEIADLRRERDGLLNRIMALTNVGSLREYSRLLPSEESTPPVSPESDNETPRLRRFPGNETLKPPSRPPTPPTPRMPYTPSEDQPEPDKEAS